MVRFVRRSPFRRGLFSHCYHVRTRSRCPAVFFPLTDRTALRLLPLCALFFAVACTLHWVLWPFALCAFSGFGSFHCWTFIPATHSFVLWTVSVCGTGLISLHTFVRAAALDWFSRLRSVHAAHTPLTHSRFLRVRGLPFCCSLRAHTVAAGLASGPCLAHRAHSASFRFLDAAQVAHFIWTDSRFSCHFLLPFAVLPHSILFAAPRIFLYWFLAFSFAFFTGFVIFVSAGLLPRLAFLTGLPFT